MLFQHEAKGRLSSLRKSPYHCMRHERAAHRCCRGHSEWARGLGHEFEHTAIPTKGAAISKVATRRALESWNP